jgi:hypothetical protein
LQALPFAQQLWSGRDRAPYFLKVHAREALDTAAATGSRAAAAAGEVWQELLQQNWRVELDAGLGGPLPESEALLLVCSPDAVRQLLAAAGAPLSNSLGSGGVAPGSMSALQVGGTQAGDPADWQQLVKRLLLAGVMPEASSSSHSNDDGSSSGGAGDSILADLEAAAAQQAAVH